MFALLQKALILAVFGVIVEILFTGLKSVIVEKNKLAISTTSLWMFPIYFIAALNFEFLKWWLHWPSLGMALVYSPLIYLHEFAAGLGLRKLLGQCPWNYPPGRWTFLGVVRFDYMPFWMVLAVCYNVISNTVGGFVL